MFSALTRFFRRHPDDSQLDFPLDAAPPRDADGLLVRLKQLGLTGYERVVLTDNRHVMVSYGDGTVRVHEGYLGASDAVLRAIVVFVSARKRAEKQAAKRIIIGHPIHVKSALARSERTHPEDEPLSTKLAEWHARYNEEHFGGALGEISVRVSRRMKSRLGHYSPAHGAAAAEIAISRRHLRKNGWDEALHTLKHEMVHQWQAETSRPIDHGAEFRRKAREVGIAPRAKRVLARN